MQFRQSSREESIEWSIITLEGVIANIGGYAGSITQIAALVLYQY